MKLTIAIKLIATSKAYKINVYTYDLQHHL